MEDASRLELESLLLTFCCRPVVLVFGPPLFTVLPLQHSVNSNHKFHIATLASDGAAVVVEWDAGEARGRLPPERDGEQDALLRRGLVSRAGRRASSSAQLINKKSKNSYSAWLVNNSR